ncbi:MAG: hypothetical protein ACPGLV_14650 [Bacteroidia bacterium]
MSFIKDLFKRREFLNPSIFNDETAERTSWHPLKRGGANFRTHKISDIEGFEISFVPTMLAYLMPLIFSFSGLIPLYMYFTDDALRENISGFMYVIPFIPMVMGVVLFKKFTKKIVFSGTEGLFYKGRKPEMPPTKGSKNFALLSDIYALQIIRERVRSSKSSYNSFELNLVLKNGDRLNVIDHGNLKRLREDATKLAEFLKVPVWDASEYRV